MNITPLAVASAFLLGGSAALAQVAVSGIADVAARNTSNQGRGSIQSLVSGSNSTSRLVFRGQEDLGNGLSASFHLEHGVLLDTGSPAQTTQFFDRRSTLSLTSNTLGELRAGRDFVPSYVSWSRFDPFSYVGVAGSNNFVTGTPLGPIRSAFASNPNSTVRASNALQWLAPAGWGGMEAGVLLAAGEGGTSANGQHKVTGARAGYVAGPLNVSAAVTRSQTELTATGAFRDTSLGGSYDFGMARVSLALRRFEQNRSRQNLQLIGLWVPMGAHELKFSYIRSDLGGTVGTTNVSANDARQLGIGYVYSLSKRTALYATVSRLDNDGAATYVVPGGPTGLAGGGKSTGTEVGIRHTF